MHILFYFAVVGSALIALFRYRRHAGERCAGNSHHQAGRSAKIHLSDSTRNLTSTPAPAPDMTSPLVLVAARRSNRRLNFRQSSLQRVPRGLRRHPRPIVSPIDGRQQNTDRTTARREISVWPACDSF